MRSTSIQRKRDKFKIISDLLISKSKKSTFNTEENLSPVIATNFLTEDLLPSCSTALFIDPDSLQELIPIQPKISLSLRTYKWKPALMGRNATTSLPTTTASSSSTSLCFRYSKKHFISENLLNLKRNLINQNVHNNSSIFSLLVSSVINFSKKFRRKSKNKFSLTTTTSTTKNITSESCSEKQKGDFQFLKKKYLLRSRKVFNHNILICGKNLLIKALTRKKLYLIRWILIVFLFSTFSIARTTVPDSMHQHRMDDDERRIIRSLFLKKFGLNDLADEINKSENSKTATKSYQTRLRIPNHVWDLYEKGEYDTVKHYFPLVTPFREELTTNESRLKYFSRKLSFKLPVIDSSNKKTENLSKVELRMSTLKFKKNCILASNSSSNLHSKYSTPSSLSNCGRLYLYEYIDSKNSKNEKRLLSVQSIGYKTNWVYFDIPQVALQKANSQSIEFIIEFSTTTNESGNNIITEFDNDYGESLAVFFENVNDGLIGKNEPVSTRSFRRNKRSTAKFHKKRKHRKHSTPTGNNECKRSSLYVDFGELNWQDWIMAPVGYEAYQCRGRCSHPMPSHLNTTNHAIIQSLINSIDYNAAPQPSCVPIEMSAISILYRDINNVVVVKTYPDMKVETCGCH